MLNTEAFSGRDLKNCSSIITHCLQAGITSGEDIRKELDTALRRRRSSATVPDAISIPLCPECGRRLNSYTRGRLELLICTNGRKNEKHVGCQYSEVVK